MKKQAYQKPTIYNSDGTKAQTGTYDIRTDPLTNITADGILDYINNNLEALNDRADNSNTADETLQANIDAEVAARQEADENLSNTSVSTTTLTVTGETSVPTANVGNNSNAIANTKFVQTAIANLVHSAPDTLDTLDELAQALGDDPNFATTMATELGKKANKTDVANTYLDKLSKTEQVVTAPIKGTLNGNAASATKATNDGNGNNIASTYLPVSGGTLTGVVNGVTPPVGDNSKKLANTEFIQASANILVPTGVVQAFAGSTTPQGWLLCDGSAVSRTDYAALYAVIGTTYGAGDGSSTFNLPNLVDKFVEGSATAGTVKSAGLPNIVGIFRDTEYVQSPTATFQDGVLTKTASRHYFDNGSDDSNTYRNRIMSIHMDASKYNSIYGASNTVQPPALTMQYIIKY